MSALKPMLMKKKLLLLSLSFLSTLSFSQTIVTAIPSSGIPNSNAEVVLRATGTAWVAGLSTADFGAGITVNSFDVIDAQTGTAHIRIEAGAAAGMRDVRVTTKSTMDELLSGFEVIVTGGSVNVIVNATPVNVIYVSDFDPNNQATAPLLFTITMYNDNTPRDVKAELEIRGQKFGLLLTANKFINGIPALGTSSWTNRDFDEYKLKPEGKQVVDLASATGIMPADQYMYVVNIYDLGHNLLGSGTGQTTISNPVADLDLISPGNELSMPSPLVNNVSPFFQWFSQASDFSFALYPVNTGQHAENDITSNQPVYHQEHIMQSSLVYPNSAEDLADGKTYAWQVKATVNSASGTQTISSQLFWFTYHAGGSNPSGVHADRIEISPMSFTINTNASIQLHAIVYDNEGQVMNVSPTYRVVPADAGTVSPDGEFKAGPHPKGCAVISEYEGLGIYATGTINFDASSMFDLESLVRQMFGLQ